jgi:hypothetical protein
MGSQAIFDSFGPEADFLPGPNRPSGIHVPLRSPRIRSPQFVVVRFLQPPQTYRRERQSELRICGTIDFVTFGVATDTIQYLFTITRSLGVVLWLICYINAPEAMLMVR